MRIIRRYFVKEFLKVFFLTLFAFILLFMVVEFFERVDEFSPNNPSAFIVIEYLLLLAPRFAALVSPMACLISVLFVIGTASRWREIIAIKASGGSVKRLAFVFLLIGLFLSIGNFILDETIVPYTNRKAFNIREVVIQKKKPVITYKGNDLWLRGKNGSFINIKTFMPKRDTAYGVSIFLVDRDFNLLGSIEADTAQWNKGQWVLYHARYFDIKDNTVKDYSSLPYPYLESPDIFRSEIKQPEDMNFFELSDYSRRLKEMGMRNPRYSVDLQSKVSYPFVNLVMVIFGVSLALSGPWGGGVKSVGLSLLISLIYWLFYSLCLSFGYGGEIPPIAASWLAPVVFCLIGYSRFRRISE